MTNISGLIRTGPKSTQRIGCHVRSVDGIRDVIAYTTFKILLTNFRAVEKKSCTEMVTCNVTRSPVSCLAVFSAMAAVIPEFLVLVVDQDTAAPMWQPQSNINDQSFAAPDE